MVFQFLLTFVSGSAFLMLVLTFSLLLEGVCNRIGGKKERESLFAPYKRFLAGRCSDRCPPFFLFASCLSLLLIYFFVPMGSLPQFIETEGDMVLIIFLLLVAQGLYIRGMKSFSGEIYQSFESEALFALSRFAVTFLVVGGVLSWYALGRGMPGSVFSLETFAATPVWKLTGIWGKLGSAMFFLLLSTMSPFAATEKTTLVDNVQIPEIFDAIRSVLAPAIIVSIFLPVRVGPAFELQGLNMYLADFIFFWIKVAVVRLYIVPAVSHTFRRSTRDFRKRVVYLPEYVVGAAGVVCFLTDLYM